MGGNQSENVAPWEKQEEGKGVENNEDDFTNTTSTTVLYAPTRHEGGRGEHSSSATIMSMSRRDDGGRTVQNGAAAPATTTERVYNLTASLSTLRCRTQGPASPAAQGMDVGGQLVEWPRAWAASPRGERIDKKALRPSMVAACAVIRRPQIQDPQSFDPSD